MVSNVSQLFQFLGLILIAYNLHQLTVLRNDHERSAEKEKPDLSEQRIAWVGGPGQEPLNTYMRHIVEAFEYRGYQIITGTQPPKTKWDVMWIHDYSLTNPAYKNHIEKAGSDPIINHIPGSGYYTSKVSLATSKCLGVPQAFQLPDQKDEFLKVAKESPEFLWVMKDNGHRNIKILPVDQLDLTRNDSFIQRFVDNPLLIDNRKFDIGVYTVVTSLQPLKVFLYNGDALLRFCAHDYHPFDANDVDKYVVGDDYTPIWEIPSLSKYYNHLNLGRRATLDAYLREMDKDPMGIWIQIGQIIAQVFQSQQEKMLTAAKSFRFSAQMFELSRFDFIVDDQLKVYLMEANMSPNLSSGHFKQNQILYEQVLHSIFSLVGISRTFTKSSEEELRRRPADSNILATDKDISVFSDVCLDKCAECAVELECQLCSHCMTESTAKMLRTAYEEHMNRRHMVRVQFDYDKIKPLTPEDHLLQRWFQLKCTEDYSFCY